MWSQRSILGGKRDGKVEAGYQGVGTGAVYHGGIFCETVCYKFCRFQGLIFLGREIYKLHTYHGY